LALDIATFAIYGLHLDYTNIFLWNLRYLSDYLTRELYKMVEPAKL